MVFRRGIALLCVAAAIALADVGVDAKEHHRDVAAPKESKVEYPNGVVLISTADNGKAPTKAAVTEDKSKHHHHREHKPASKKHGKNVDDDDESSDDDSKRHHHRKAPKGKKAEEVTAPNGDVTRKYAHGSVRISKGASSSTVHKKEHVHKVHASTSKSHHTHHKDASGDVTQDFKLEEGVNQFTIEGVPLKITVDNGHVDVNVNGKHVKAGSEVVVDAPEKHAKKEHKHAKEAKKEHKKEANKEVEKEHKKEHKKEHAKKEHKKEAAKKEETAKEVSVSATADKAAIVDEKAERVTELATKLSKSNHGFFTTETAPIVFICGIVGALAAVVGIAAVAVSRARDNGLEDNNLQSVLNDDASELDIEAAVQDAPADSSDSLDDSESDNDDDDEAGEGTFANNERAGTVSV